MSPFVFWPALVLSLVLSVFLATTPQREVMWAAATVLAWTVPVALAWKRWVQRPAVWIARVATGAIFAMLVGVVQAWWPRTDVFIHYSNCAAPRAETFWPLAFTWACGLGLMTFTLWGSAFQWRQTLLPRVRTIAWWLVGLAWTAACAFVLSRNLAPGVLGTSLLALAKLGAAALAVAALIGLPLWWGTRGGRKAEAQTREDFAKLAPDERERLIDLIDTTARRGEYRLMYRPVAEGAAGDPIARVGGDPLSAPGETWPVDAAGHPALFLLQVPLEGTAHPVWRDRVLSVYLDEHEHALVVRCHARSDELQPMPAPPGPKLAPCAVMPLAIPPNEVPAGDDEGDGEWPDADWFFERMPELKAALGSATAHPDRLLGMLITGDTRGHAYIASDLIIVGGYPALIQGVHGATCPDCGQPMRFLMQFGDVTEDFALGDAGAGYVYGCDAHPQRLEAFSDCY
ncbi:hypothetical protein [Lysobacter sp. FW306-1B-D06B]|uniref:hypothetical protein n=1 Tax=Lysobacter sp. FW306-1B-D06B TaxID=3140250 RepID=UPI003140C32A